MKQKNLSLWLRIIAVFIGVVGLVVFFAAVPSVIGDYQTTYPQHHAVGTVAKVLCYLSAAPFIVAIAQFYVICVRIGRDQSFSLENSHSLRLIGYMALTDTVMVFCVFGALLIIGLFNISFCIAAVMIMLFGILVTIAAFALSHLVLKAFNLKSENDLTI